MTPKQRHQEVKRLFHAVLELGEAERLAFLERECKGDRELVEEVESVLGLHAESEATSAKPRLEAKSVLLSLGPEGHGAGIRLRDLGDEARLPELQMGAEKYRLLGELGEGGMGKVYLAYDQDLRRRVALKVMRKSGGTNAARFLEEAQVVAQLEHPNIVPVHEVGLTADGKLFYTMPVVRGRTLSAVLQALRDGDLEREFSLARRMQIFVQIGQAVSYAHAKGVVHRDLKPGNVMLGSHGEVQVLDWGLSKVIEAGGVDTARDVSLTASRHVLGTPWYMSPEQVSGEDVDGRTDVWALGVILYELLCLERPFEGGVAEVIASVVRDEPEPPLRRAPGPLIPTDLEAVCLKALNKRPADRQARVNEMLAPVQTWLEAEADKAKRHDRAEEKAAEGRARLAEYRRLKGEVKRLEGEAEEVARRFKGWQPVAEKGELFAAQDAVSLARRALTAAASSVVAVLTEGLGFEAGNETVRGFLADYYWDRFREAEQVNDTDSVEFFGRLVADYHGGRYARELKGDGILALESDPPGAEVWLYQLVEQGPVLVEVGGRSLGVTPVGPLPMAMGSYLVILKKDGYRDVRYPTYIARNREWIGKVKFYTQEEMGPRMVYVPGGPFVQGGDPGCRGCDLPRSEPWIEDFFIDEHPVTMAEYLEFLNDVAGREGLEAAKKRAPRQAAQAPTYLLEDGAGRLKLPEVDADGDRWNVRWPAFGFSWHDAVGYCEWRSRREEREGVPAAHGERVGEGGARGGR